MDTSPLANYLALVDRVDAICRTVSDRFAEEIACRPGCDRCCRHLTLFPVEAAAMTAAAMRLPPAERETLRRCLAEKTSTACPLLFERRCLLYAARPIICRTHGLPLLITGDGDRRIDYCPDNFRGRTSLPGEAVIDLTRLNEALAAINALFVAAAPELCPRGHDRLSIADALLRALQDEPGR